MALFGKDKNELGEVAFLGYSDGKFAIITSGDFPQKFIIPENELLVSQIDNDIPVLCGKSSISGTMSSFELKIPKGFTFF